MQQSFMYHVAYYREGGIYNLPICDNYEGRVMKETNNNYIMSNVHNPSANQKVYKTQRSSTCEPS